MYLFIVYLICIFGGYLLILTGMSCLKMLLFKFIIFNDRIKTHKTKEKKKTCNLLYSQWHVLGPEAPHMYIQVPGPYFYLEVKK